MTEPVYKFVKGEGWIISPTPFVNYHGQKYTFEARLPKRGEYYYYASPNNINLCTNGKADIDKFVDWASKSKYSPHDFIKCHFPGDCTAPEIVTIVVL